MTGDNVQPYEVDDDQVADWLNEAEQEACLRADLLYDTVNSISAGIAMVTDQSQYALTSTALTSEFYNFDWFDIPEHKITLKLITLKELDNIAPAWKTADSSLPEYAITDLLPRQLVVYPAPSSTYNGDYINYRGYRLPTTAMSQDSHTPEIAVTHHRNLAYWVTHKWFELPELDIYDPNKSARDLARFEEAFGPRPDAIAEQLIYRKQGVRFEPRMTFFGG